MDYHSTGRRLREEWLKGHQRAQQALHRAAAKMQNQPQRPEHDFIRALIQHARGNSKYLIDYLRSRRPLSAVDREQFAQILEGVLDRKTRRGRPPNRDAIVAAMQATAFYKTWQTENKKADIKDHGHSNAMKDEAARFVVEELEPNPSLDYQTVRDLMDRPKSRREL